MDLTAPTAPVIVNAQSTFNATYMVTLQTSPSPDAYLKNFSYTLDGTNPTCSTGTLRDASTGYTITIPAATTTLKAVACDLAGNVSPVTSATYTYNGVSPLVPTISPSSSDIKSATVVTISQNATADLNFKEFRFTTDGTAPTCTSGTALTAAPFTVTVSSSVTLKAVTCVFGGNTSPVASAVYTYDATVPLVPTLSAASRSFNTAFNVTVTQNATTDVNFKHFRYMSALGTNPPYPGSCSDGTALAAGGTIAITTDTTAIAVVACDYAGNMSSAASAVYTYDTKAPVLTFNSASPLSPSSNLRPSVNLTSTDAGTATIYSDSSCAVAISAATAVTANTAISVAITTNLTSNATNAIYAKAVDATGNNSLCTSLTSYVTDVAAPTLTYNSISPASNNAVRNPVVTVTASETGWVTLYNGSTCVTAISDAIPVVAATSKGIMTYALPASTSNTIYGTATDSSNNTSACSALLTTYVTTAGNGNAVIASTASTWNSVAVTTCNAAATCSSTYPWTLPNTTVTNATAIGTITINSGGYVKMLSTYTGTIQNIIVNTGGILEIQNS
ncbi:MAG: hypothetical protein EBU49_08425, partial [Proteobacteria bacterium]|nr:hypothetical protein [Pseudomonadota bacterium]